VKIHSAEFLTSGARPEEFPYNEFPEIAFGGRSNVGKSSLINSLLQRKNLVRTSSTPGRTQRINFFVINNAFNFVDLPGYGYAKVPKEMRASWGPMIETYLVSRPKLFAIVCVFDLRRGIEDDDQMLLEAAGTLGIQPIVVFTKADKLKPNRRYNRIREIAQPLGVRPDDFVLFSGTKGWGIDELWKKIRALGGIS
jgi:GTP-binding protein